MTHIELSLSPLAQPAAEAGVSEPLERWATSVAAAEEPCLVLNTSGIIVAASPPCAPLFFLKQAFDFVGRHILDPEVLVPIDFTAAANELSETEREQIPPLLAVSSGRLARGLLRIRKNLQINRTLDAIATPLLHQHAVVGSLTFFADVH